jgi:hypothetical protein
MSTAGRRRLMIAAAVGASALALRGIAPSRAADVAPLSRDDWRAIQRAIGDQLDALRAGDAERAFGFAADGIRAQVGDAAAFMAMVRGGYEALLVARYTEFLEGAVIDGLVIQPLRLVAPDNTVRVALYTMQRDGTTWRIAGCTIAPSTVRAA